MTAKSRSSHGVIGALTAFILAVVYFGFTASYLPVGAGPDAPANYKAVVFYLEHKELAVFPEHEDLVKFTPYGTTRLLRPPLSFLVSALLAPISPLGEKGSRNVVGSTAWHIAPRIGSVLLCALTVAIVFLGLYWYFGNTWYAVFGSMLTGLLPQFTFIASHLNDDSSAIFSATMLFVALILVYQRKTQFPTIVFLGFSVGLVLVSKLSAWLVLPTAGLAFLLFFRIEKRRWLPCSLILITLTIVGGGWWPLFNLSHYGIDDFRASNIQRELAKKHRILDVSQGRGFIFQGIGFRELILNNHKNFIGASLKSTIGHLDWLKLTLGNLQYGLYYVVFIFAMLYYLMRLLFISVRFWTGAQEASDSRRFVFETFLFVTIVFQVFAYTWRNVYQDIQVQGKYLLPVILPVLILSLTAARVLAQTLLTRLRTTGRGRITLQGRNILQAVALLCVFTIGLVHLDGLVRFVLPFYWPPAYSLKTGDVEFLDLEQTLWTELHEDISITILGDAWMITSTGEDPQLVLPQDVCNRYGKHFLVRVDLIAEESNKLAVYVDEGKGFRADFQGSAAQAKYGPGNQSVMLGLSAAACRRLRLDPMVGPGQMTITAIGFVQLTIRPPKALVY